MNFEQPDLGKKVLELRLSKGLTQVELAEICNLSLRTIQRIEQAEVCPRTHTIKLIFSNLDYNVYDSFGQFSYKMDRTFYRFKNILKKINLKSNTMKKLSLLSIVLIFISASFFFNSKNLSGQSIEGWFKVGSEPSSYKIGLDTNVNQSGSTSAYLESIEKKINGFGSLMQTCSANNYLGKRVKMTGYIKVENVTDWAGMWLRVDAKTTNKMLSFDNMQDRPIKGNTDWVKYVIILDVPEDSGTLNFGVLLTGTGKIWFDNILFEVVDKMDIQPTKKRAILEKPSNINFEK